jgi:hypothetical protein
LTPFLRASGNDERRRRQYRAATIALAAIGVGLLASCSWVPFVGKKSEAPATPSCPVAAVLHPLSNTVVFSPGGDKKPPYVAWYGIFSDITANCSLNGVTLSAALDNVIVAERGPSVRGNDVDLNYFVALTGSDQTILGKKTFSVHVSVPPTEKRGGVDDHVEVTFTTGGRPISDLNIMVGFQDSPDAVEFYKHYPGR